jgi:hypothetical protein
MLKELIFGVTTAVIQSATLPAHTQVRQKAYKHKQVQVLCSLRTHSDPDQVTKGALASISPSVTYGYPAFLVCLKILLRRPNYLNETPRSF